MNRSRRDVLAAGAAFGTSFGAAWAVAPRAGAQTPGFVYTGRLEQGGFLIGRASPRAPVAVDGAILGEASADGLFAIGFDRDAPGRTTIAVGSAAARTLAVAPVAYDVQRIDGLPADQVEPTDPALLARIAAELKLKQAALLSRDDTQGFAQGFAPPLEHAVRTSHFGPQRILNGVPKTPHYGVDLAAPTGTPILAPAPGLVVLAQPDMHFEGGLTLIDHGQGLVAGFLHQSRLDVTAGQRVTAGQTIGAVGMKGRATGPHLCWRLTWRGRHMDPSLLLGAISPV